jgi:mRNA interferase MazF
MKNFDAWNEVKKIDDSNSRQFFKERDIWWVSLGINVGDEEDGKGDMYIRPVLVIRKFNNNVFWGCPLSKKIKINNPYYISIELPAGTRSVIVSQMRLLDTKRLKEKIVMCGIADFDKIKKALRDLI